MKTIKMESKTLYTLDITLDDAVEIWNAVKGTVYKRIVVRWEGVEWANDNLAETWLRDSSTSCGNDGYTGIAKALEYDGCENSGIVFTREGKWHWRPVFYRYGSE